MKKLLSNQDYVAVGLTWVFVITIVALSIF